MQFSLKNSIFSSFFYIQRHWPQLSGTFIFSGVPEYRCTVLTCYLKHSWNYRQSLAVSCIQKFSSTLCMCSIFEITYCISNGDTRKRNLLLWILVLGSDIKVSGVLILWWNLRTVSVPSFSSWFKDGTGFSFSHHLPYSHFYIQILFPERR